MLWQTLRVAHTCACGCTIFALPLSTIADMSFLGAEAAAAGDSGSCAGEWTIQSASAATSYPQAVFSVCQTNVRRVHRAAPALRALWVAARRWRSLLDPGRRYSFLPDSSRTVCHWGRGPDHLCGAGRPAPCHRPHHAAGGLCLGRGPHSTRSTARSPLSFARAGSAALLEACSHHPTLLLPYLAMISTLNVSCSCTSSTNSRQCRYRAMLQGSP